MAPTEASCRAMFRTVAQTSYHEWPAYDSTQLYDRSSLAALKEDIHTVAREWFDHDAHESVDQFVCHYPLEYVEFDPNDRYTDSTQYGMEQLFRVFLIQELHGWTHETAIVTYLQQQSSLCRVLGFTSVPDQSTLWRSWHQRFTDTGGCKKRKNCATPGGAYLYEFTATSMKTFTKPSKPLLERS